VSINLRLPQFSAVIFDMDGLAIDSEPTFIVAWRKAVAEFGIQLEDELVRSLLGCHSDDVESALKETIGKGFNGERFCILAARYWREHVESQGIARMPGLDGLLELLDRNRIPYALATNSDSTNTSECLLLSGLENRFSLVLTRDQVYAGKPEPDLFVNAARRMGVSASECLVLEDSAIGLLAASRAGATPVLVKAQPTYEESQQLAAISFRSLHEVADAIRVVIVS
jgi:beta-phosphoglucomutase